MFGRIDYTLTDLYNISSGLSKPAKDFGSGYPFLSFKDVFYNYFVPEELTQLVQSSDKEREKCSVKRGDVFLTRTSETMDDLGMSCVALKDYENSTFNGFTKRLRPKEGVEIVPEYVAYYLRSPKFRREMLAFSTLSTRASLNNDMIGRLKISLPDYNVQKAIAHVLKCLDDKIECNRKMNETLEQMAQAMFKSWFVDFDPVIDNALAAGNEIPFELKEKAARRKALGSKRKLLPEDIRKLFPDKFQPTEDNGWIPDGWEICQLKNIAKHIKKTINPGNNPDIYFYHYSIPAYDKGKSPILEMGGEIKSNKYEVIPNSILMSKLNPRFPRVWCMPKDVRKHSICSTEFQVIYPDLEFYYGFIYCLLKSKPVQDELTACARGTSGSHQRVEPGLIFSSTVYMKQSIIECFDNVMNGVWEALWNTNKQNNSLCDLRDTLLPKLISGELRIKDAERFIEV